MYRMYTRKFLPGENFANFSICSHWQNFYHANFLSCVNNYILLEDMTNFTALAKIYSTEYSCNIKVARLGEIFVKRKFSRIRYSATNGVTTRMHNIHNYVMCIVCHARSADLDQEEWQEALLIVCYYQ